jgi:hypothetical protein
MKTIKSILMAGAVIVSASVYAQTTPTSVPATPQQVPANQQIPVSPQNPATQTLPATQQNSETFNKPASERAMNPASVPLQQGTNIKDTIIPGNTRMMSADSSKKALMTDTTIMNKKGSGEMDTTSMQKTGKGMKRRKNQ